MKLFLRLVIVISLTALAMHSQTKYDREKQWENEIQSFVAIDKKQSPPQNAILFTGSSTIRMWTSLRADFPNVNVINRGFGGSRFEDLVFFGPSLVTPYNPKKIVVYSGENDIQDGQSAENVLDDFRAFVAFRDKNLPKTPIIYISMKPSIARWKLWPIMKSANDMIKSESARHKRVKFVDISKRMLGSDGDPLPNIFLSDGLHLNAAGYAIIRETLAPYLR